MMRCTLDGMVTDTGINGVAPELLCPCFVTVAKVVWRIRPITKRERRHHLGAAVRIRSRTGNRILQLALQHSQLGVGVGKPYRQTDTDKAFFCLLTRLSVSVIGIIKSALFNRFYRLTAYRLPISYRFYR